jgi:hypothetical protein
VSQKPVVFENADESEGEVGSSEDDYDSDDPTAALIRETKREVASETRKSRNVQKQNEDSPRGPRRAPNGDVSLRGLTSLSGSGDKKNQPRNMSNAECFRCGQKGHMQSDCPKPRSSAGRGRGGGRR